MRRADPDTATIRFRDDCSSFELPARVALPAGFKPNLIRFRIKGTINYTKGARIVKYSLRCRTQSKRRDLLDLRFKESVNLLEYRDREEEYVSYNASYVCHEIRER